MINQPPLLYIEMQIDFHCILYYIRLLFSVCNYHLQNRRRLHYSEVTARVIWGIDHSQSSLALFAYIPKYDQAVIPILTACRLIKKKYSFIFEITEYLCPNCPGTSILMEFIPKMKSSSHIYISIVVKMLPSPSPRVVLSLFFLRKRQCNAMIPGYKSCKNEGFFYFTLVMNDQLVKLVISRQFLHKQTNVCCNIFQGKNQSNFLKL